VFKAECDKMCHLLVAGCRFSRGTLVSPLNKTGRNCENKILLKVALNAEYSNQNYLCTFKPWFMGMEYIG